MAYRIPQHVLHSTLDDESVLLNLHSGEYYSLNESGSIIWNLLSNGHDQNEIIKELLGRFDIPLDTLEQDFNDIVEDLKTNGLLVED